MVIGADLVQRRLFLLISTPVALNFALLVAPLLLVCGLSEAQGNAQMGKYSAGDAAGSNHSKRDSLPFLCWRSLLSGGILLHADAAPYGLEGAGVRTGRAAAGLGMSIGFLQQPLGC